MIEILKGLSGFVFIIYCLGFLITGIHFLKYDYITFGFVKARYASAGMIFVAPLVIAIISTYLLVRVGLYRTPVIGHLMNFFVAAQLGMVYLLAFDALKMRKPDLAVMLAWFLSWYAYFPYFQLDIEGESITLKPDSTTAVVLIGSVGLFAIFVYPMMPATMGGGKPVSVQLVLRDSTRMESLPFDTDSCYSEHLLLFDKTDKSYVLLIDFKGEDKLFELDKDLVNGVVYGVHEEPEEGDSASLPPGQKLQEAEEKIPGE